MGKNLRQLQISLGDWLNLNDTPGQDNSDRLPKAIRADIINMAAQELLRKHDTKFGEFSATFQTVDETLAYPTSEFLPGVFSRPRTAWYLDPTDQEQSIVLTFVEKDEFDRLFPVAGIYGYPVPMGGGVYGQTQLGEPTYYTYWAGKIELGLVPNRAFTMFLTGYRLLPDLVADNDSNLLTEEAWPYLLFKGCALSSLFGVEDDRIPQWDMRANKIADDLAFEHYHARMTAKRISQAREPG